MGSNIGSQPERQLMIAGRVDVINKQIIEIIKKYLADNTSQFILVKESGKKTGKEHLHFLVTKNSNQLIKSECDTIRKDIIKLISFDNTKQYYVGGVRDIRKCFLYTLKDLNVVEETWIDRGEYDSMIAETIRINDEKTQPMKHQLVNYIYKLMLKVDEVLGDEYIVPLDYQAVMKAIIEYHVSRDYLPPTPTMLLQYTIYCMTKNKLDTSLLYLEKLKI